MPFEPADHFLDGLSSDTVMVYPSEYMIVLEHSDPRPRELRGNIFGGCTTGNLSVAQREAATQCRMNGLLS